MFGNGSLSAAIRKARLRLSRQMISRIRALCWTQRFSATQYTAFMPVSVSQADWQVDTMDCAAPEFTEWLLKGRRRLARNSTYKTPFNTQGAATESLTRANSQW
jgi:hypothetical protein